MNYVQQNNHIQAMYYFAYFVCCRYFPSSRYTRIFDFTAMIFICYYAKCVFRYSGIELAGVFEVNAAGII